MNAETTLCEIVPRSDHKSAFVCGATCSGFSGETVFVVHCRGQKALDNGLIRMDMNRVSEKHVWCLSGSLPYITIFLTD